MKTTDKTTIKIEALVKAPIEKVWRCWTDPNHIIKWNNASDDWQTPFAENDLRVGGKLLFRMEAKDKSAGFDFEGTYDEVIENQKIVYTIADGRKVSVTFTEKDNEIMVTETFEAENTNPIEMQRDGWQAILNNFKKHVENTVSAMNSLHFEITINAPVEKVYKLMISKPTYGEWTKEFNPTSRFEGSWEKGSKILFIGSDEKGNVGGMVSKIKENIPNKFISIEHVGLLHGDKEITSGPEIEGWSGALENYTFTSENGKTILAVDTDSNEEYKAYFEETWPKALNKLKSICEQ
ncbi:MAG: hypothetical protein VR77_12625 [Flavobacteriales bacterium BRH_c54]|nr:MAG: hypothetical protein VR77_12625 [Flavobacteriales bacterium BRH_c54]